MNTWAPWIYHYGLGTILFSVSLVIAFRSGALKFNRPVDRRILLCLIAGLATFMVGHGLWIAAVAGGDAP